MGTWGSGPFSNDTGLDVCDLLSDMDEDEKIGHLRDIFTGGPASTQVEPIRSDELIACAALVALALPGGAVAADPGRTGDYDPDAEANADDEWVAAFPREPGSDLVALALDAFRAATATGSCWFTEWADRSDGDAAVANMERIARVLQNAISGQSDG
jgi:hypothetical protein